MPLPETGHDAIVLGVAYFDRRISTGRGIDGGHHRRLIYLDFSHFRPNWSYPFAQNVAVGQISRYAPTTTPSVKLAAWCSARSCPHRSHFSGCSGGSGRGSIAIRLNTIARCRDMSPASRKEITTIQLHNQMDAVTAAMAK